MKDEKKKYRDDLNKRYCLTGHYFWAVETPNGLMAVVLHEGPGAKSFMQDVAVSDQPIDILMKESIEKCHGMDMNAPTPGPMLEKLI